MESCGWLLQFLLACVLITGAHPQDGGNSTPSAASQVGQLLAYLLHNEANPYDATIRPQPRSGLDLYGSFSLFATGDINEKGGYIETLGSLQLIWNDLRLKWDSRNFSGITELSLDGQTVWHPALTSTSYNEPVLMRTTVQNDGSVKAIFMMRGHTPCAIDMTKFPSDTQSCSIYIATYDEKIVFWEKDAIYTRSSDMMGSIGQHRAWNVTSLFISTLKMYDAFNGLNVTIIIQRHAAAFSKMYVAPIILLLLLTPTIFLLPPDSTEKLSYGGLLLLASMLVAERIDVLFPPTVDAMPYLARMSAANEILIFLAILLVALISSGERIGRGRPLPSWLKMSVNRHLGPLLLVNESPELRDHVKIAVNGDSDQSAIVANEARAATYETQDYSVDGIETRDEALFALVRELKMARLQKQASDDWTNFFSILNRLLFLLFLLISIVILCSFATL